MLLRFPPWKVALVLATLILGLLLTLPNVLTEKQREDYFSWWPTQPLKLGLDLKGGASISLEIPENDLRTNELRQVNRMVGEKLRETPLIPVRERTPQGDSVLVRVTNSADTQRAIDRLRTLGAADVYTIGQRADGAIEIKFTEARFDQLMESAIQASRQAIQRRADGSGLVEPNIVQQGENRVLIEVPGLTPERVNELVDLLTQAGVLTFNMVDTQADPSQYQIGVPRNNRIALPNESMGGAPQVIMLDPIITGNDLANAFQAYDERNQPSISFSLHAQGAQKFGRATTTNVGRPFAIVLDNKIISAPTIESPIMGGTGRITGSFTMQEANDLAVVLKSGQLPAKLVVVERRVVDPSLGADSIQAGVTASIVGVILVAIFMIATYGLLGIFAVLALICNMWMMIGVLSGFGATLTLPGIAGILLTMGMAVDYNVLIFERIREEKRAGRSPITSVEAGYEMAMATIVDANVTHLVAALVMFNLGEGPVRGFALTLAIGVLTSIFTAVIVARWVMSIWLRTARPKWIPI
ncbi:MAG: protein translocase subunit SecD [Hyphomonadaceae bacterium]